MNKQMTSQIKIGDILLLFYFIYTTCNIMFDT